MLLRVLAVAAVGGCVGMLVAYLTGMARWLPPGSERLAYPHVVPKSPYGVSLRFAMVHDAIHERFPRHGTAYYRERNRRVRLALEERKGQPPTPGHFALLDDLAVGLEFAGEHDEAIRLMRDKLRQQLELKLPREQLYSTYANLGTFLILGPFRRVRPGNQQDKEVLREGLRCIRTAIEINPQSHFGREIWQAVIIEYMIALYDDPDVLLRFDMVGNRLDADLDGVGESPLAMVKFGRWGANHGGVARARRGDRGGITYVGAEPGWAEAVKSSHTARVPFDEPTLGIVGMWRLGGGAHPYFAVALGETMLRVGQRYLAWNAYERAARLANLAWPDPHLQARFTEHCRRRQAAIEATLPQAEVGRLRPAFEKELAFGLDYQKRYQRYEEERIAAGAATDDPWFHDDFHARNGPIASPVGSADWFHVSDWHSPSWAVNLTLLFAGAFALGAAIWLPRG